MLEKIVEWVKTNRLKVFVFVFLSAIVVLMYVHNTIQINDLLENITRKDKEIQELNTRNEILKSKIIELQSAERITKIGEEKLGLKKPDKVPIIIEETTEEDK